MARVKAEFELDGELLQLADDRAAAMGMPRNQVIEDALRRQLQPSSLARLVAEVRSGSDLSEQEANSLAYAELAAVRAERRAAATT
jgi:hypothetical protein